MAVASCPARRRVSSVAAPSLPRAPVTRMRMFGGTPRSRRPRLAGQLTWDHRGARGRPRGHGLRTLDGCANGDPLTQHLVPLPPGLDLLLGVYAGRLPSLGVLGARIRVELLTDVAP